jgi:hypothetical protein
MHLEQTGELDEATVTEMKKPRCGNADVMKVATVFAVIRLVPNGDVRP